MNFKMKLMTRLFSAVTIMLVTGSAMAQVTPLDGPWHTGSKNADVAFISDTNANSFTWGSTGNLDQSSTTGTLWSYFGDQTLTDDGDFITLSFDVNFTDLIPSGGADFRFGLYNDGGSQLTQNLPIGSNADPAFASSLGYWTEWSGGAGSTPDLRLRSVGHTHPLSGTNSTLIVAGTDPVDAAVQTGVSYTYTMSVQRLTANQYGVTSTLNGQGLDETVNGVANVEGLSIPSTFNAVYFLNTPQNGNNEMQLNNLQVETGNAPLPVLKLTIDRDTSAMTISNDTGVPIELISYSIRSSAGALVNGQWTSLEDAGEPDWVEFSDPASKVDLSEGTLTPKTYNDSDVVAIGDGWLANPIEDLIFDYMLSDGVTLRTGIIEYLGTPIAIGDLNSDGVIDEGDWPNLIDNMHADLSALTSAEAHSFGDLNGDGNNNLDDYDLFKQAYIDANGAAAWQALITNVPEPTTMSLLSLGGLALLRRRKRNTKPNQRNAKMNLQSSIGKTVMPAIALVAALLTIAPMAQALPQEIIFDFGVNNQAGSGLLQNGAIPVETSTAGVTPAGNLTATDIPTGIGLELVWNGLTATRPIIARDRSPLGGGTGGTFTLDNLYSDILLRISAFNFSGLDPSITYDLQFIVYDDDSSNGQETTIHNTTDGANDLIGTIINTPNSMLTSNTDFSLMANGLSSDVGGNLTFSIVGTPNANANAAGLILRFDAPPVTLGLQVNTTNGAVSLVNDSLSTHDIDYYQIDSAGGAFDVGNWTSLEDQDYEGGGSPQTPAVGDGWEEAGGSSDTLLAEAYLQASSSISLDEKINMGKIYDTGIGGEDLTFMYRLSDGTRVTGYVEYVEGIVILGDVNGDGLVNGFDVDPFVDVLLNGPYQEEADVNEDGAVNGFDVDPFVALVLGGGSNPQGTEVPEPMTLSLLAFGGLLALRRKK